MGKLVGIDFGTKRIGVSISDSDKKIAFPRGILEREGGSYCIRVLKELLNGEDINGFVIGFPYKTSDIENEKKEKNRKSELIEEIQNYASKLREVFNKPVYFLDERFTTKIALQSMLSTGLKKQKRQKSSKKLDDVSAQLILQAYLDRKNS